MDLPETFHEYAFQLWYYMAALRIIAITCAKRQS